MASKTTSKRTTITSTTTSTSGASESATPGASTSYTERPSSPLSPTRITRLREKHDLQNLNDRLAHYIDLVRSLESDRSRLTRQIETIEETKTKEIQTFKNIYENELQDTRRLIDELSREKAKLEIDSKRLFEENMDLKIKLDKKTKDCVIAEKNAHVLEARVGDLSTKYNQAVADRKKALDELKDLEKEYEKLKAQADDLRKKLEDETMVRLASQNALQTLKEDFDLKQQIFNEQMTETQTRRQVEISEIDGRLSEQYQQKLEESLKELREEYEAQMRANREEIQYMYENKFKTAMSQANVNNDMLTKNAEEMRSMRSRLDTYQSRIGELEAGNAALQARIRDMEKLLELERMKHLEDRTQLEAELQRMRDEMNNQMREYQELMEIKIALDMEINLYRKMLESEEQRLNITPNQSPNVSQSFRGTPLRRTPIRGGKRKRTMLEESESESRFEESSHAKGDVEISGVCPDGKFVKLHNKGNREVVLSGWQVMRKAGDSETVYKFHRSVKMEPGSEITIWSADQGQSHEPPYNLVMKSQKWFVADNMSTTLLNNTGEEMAISERKRMQVSHLLSRRQEYSGYQPYRSSNMDELYHQQGDPQGEDRCCVM